MRNCKRMPYVQIIRWRIRVSYALLALMLAYMVLVAEMGGGDSRRMTDLASAVSRLLFFGGFGVVVSRIAHNKRLLRDRARLREQQMREQDERNQYLHDKSGGAVLDILLLFLLFATVTTALYNMTAFYVSIVILAVTLFLKITAYVFYSSH